MKNLLNKIRAALEALTAPLTGLVVTIGEDMDFNEDGYWNEYWARRNAKEAKREAKRAAKAERRSRR